MTAADSDLDNVALRFRKVIAWLGYERAGAFGKKYGVGSSKLSHWVGGRNYPGLEVLLRLKAEHGISLDWIFTGDTDGMPRARAEELAAATPIDYTPRPREAAKKGRPGADVISIAGPKTRRRGQK